MNRITRVAAVCMVLGFAAGPVLAQSGGAASKLSKLKALRSAQPPKPATAAPTPTPTPTPAPTPITTIQRPPVVVATPTTTPTTPPVTTPAASASAKASASASSSAKPPGSATPGFTNTAASATPLPPKDRTDTAAIALDLEALKKSRPDRRHAEFLDLQQRWGNLLADPRVGAELKQHAQRIAYLQRIRALAVKANDAKLVKDVDLLITKEELRDANAMNALRSGALPVPTPAPVVPAAAAPAPAAAGGGGAK